MQVRQESRGGPCLPLCQGLTLALEVRSESHVIGTSIDVEATDPRMTMWPHSITMWPRQQHAVLLKKRLVEASQVLKVLVFEENVLWVGVVAG
jgi:hypothetical protein